MSLVEHQAFAKSRLKPWGWLNRRRMKYYLARRVRMPTHSIVKPCFRADRWILFFMYLPDGKMTPSQADTLQRLGTINAALFVICATPSKELIPNVIYQASDALYWKALSGFDFSAYAIGLNEISRRSEGASVFVLNDTTYGPFNDIFKQVEAFPWDLTGITASDDIEDHIQSYAFYLRSVTKERMRKLRPVFPMSYSFNDREAVIYCFETRFAAVASKFMSVGSIWSSSGKVDTSISHSLALLENGCPLIKKSIFGKHRGNADSEAIRRGLLSLGYDVTNLPVPTPTTIELNL